MELRTYRAATMQDALAMIRQELGPDAAILHARQVRMGPLRWLPGRRGFEVIASPDVNVPTRLARRAESPPPASESARNESSDRSTARAAVDDELRTQISQLQAMVERLCRGVEQPKAPDPQPGLFQVYTDLIEAEVGQATARELVERIRQEAGDHDVAPNLVRARLCELLEREIQAQGPIAPTPGRCHVVALVGPTGVGKTTTIAKLAANFRLREKRRVGLITVDTYRVAAVEQLRAYAEIIELPMEVVATPREMRAAIERLAQQDLVLIDTGGRSPADDVKIRELRAVLNEARPDEVHLVLSSASSAATLHQTAERFQPVSPTALLFTKLDEALTLGNLIEALLRVGLPLSYLTDGQNVPDDIEVAESGRLVRRILGIEKSA
jgi:flagellar biosynthesis protein FlhF